MGNRSSCAASILALLAALWAGVSQAQVVAVFEGNQSRVCVSSSGFDTNQVLLGPGSISSGMDFVTVTFNADGTGTFNSKSLSIGHNALSPGLAPASESEGSNCTFTYTYDASTGVVRTTAAPCQGTIITGPAAGQQTEVSGQIGEFHLVNNRTTLIWSRTSPDVETFRNLTTGFTAERICHRAGIRFIKR
jgi:hypothetical protein